MNFLLAKSTLYLALRKSKTNESLFKSEKGMNDTLKQFNIMAFTQVKDLADENQNLYNLNKRLDPLIQETQNWRR